MQHRIDSTHISSALQTHLEGCFEVEEWVEGPELEKRRWLGLDGRNLTLRDGEAQCSHMTGAEVVISPTTNLVQIRHRVQLI